MKPSLVKPATNLPSHKIIGSSLLKQASTDNTSQTSNRTSKHTPTATTTINNMQTEITNTQIIVSIHVRTLILMGINIILNIKQAN